MPANSIETTPDEVQESTARAAAGLSNIATTFLIPIPYIIRNLYSIGNQRFFGSFLPYYKVLTAEDITNRVDDGRCVITREAIISQNSLQYEYTLIQDQRLSIEERSSTTNSMNIAISHGTEESQKIEEMYGHTDPLLQASITGAPTRADIGIQNSITGEKISYDSLSSLGSVSQEGFTISAATGSITGLITEQAQVITDVGGLSTGGRDRTITNTGAQFDDGTESRYSVTTSGY